MRAKQRYTVSVSLLHIIYSTSTGHTEHVVDTLIAALKTKVPTLMVEKQRAEMVKPEDFSRGDVLLLACGTWNTGGSEGQLNVHMHALLKERAAATDLQKKPCLLMALGDSRYHYTARAMEHFMTFVTQHNGMVADSLVIINEPYGQEDKVEKWVEKILTKLPILVS